MIEPNNFAHIATLKEVWEALLSTRKADLLKQLVQLKLANSDSMEEYLNKMVIISLQVKNIRLNIDDELMAFLMLTGRVTLICFGCWKFENKTSCKHGKLFTLNMTTT